MTPDSDHELGFHSFASQCCPKRPLQIPDFAGCIWAFLVVFPGPQQFRHCSSAWVPVAVHTKGLQRASWKHMVHESFSPAAHETHANKMASAPQFHYHCTPQHASRFEAGWWTRFKKKQSLCLCLLQTFCRFCTQLVHETFFVQIFGSHVELSCHDQR